MTSMDTQQQDASYNGWTNYPTWCVDLWLSKDLYNEAMEHAKWHAEKSADARNGLAYSLKAWVEDDLTPDLGASFPADLLGYALGQVNWHEIADSWIEQVEDQ